MIHHLSRNLGRTFVFALVTGATLTAAPSVRAEQFVLFDVMFTYTKQQADTSSPSKSHYYVKAPVLNAMRPANWLSPIDYRNGTVHIRTEVIDKPAGSEITQWILCYIANQGGYGCAGTGTYREEGLYERDVTMTSWWNNTTIMWQAGIKQMDLVMKDSNGSTGFTHLRPDSEKFFPTTMRITMVQVSAGAKYDPSMVPNLPPSPVGDGGAPSDAAPSDGGTADGGGAGSGGTSGGAGGSGGDSGSGGQPGTGGSTGSGGAGGSLTGLAGSGGGTAPGTGGAPGAGNSVVGGSGCAVVPAAARETSAVATVVGLSMLVLSAAVAGRRRRRREAHDAEVGF